MDWNSKWEWENLDIFSSKASESPKKIQATDWGVVEGEIDAGSFNVSGGGGGGSGSGSGSDLGHGSSAKSSISASTDCSSKQGKSTSTFTFEAFGDLPKDFSKKNELVRAQLNKTSPSLETSVGSGEPLIGLKLGKRTYFENSCTGSVSKTSSFSTTPASSTSSKKIKLSCQAAHTPRCQVEGCNLDLSSAKEYHRKHRVCESHSKSSKVVVAGLERRFCQQCSR